MRGARRFIAEQRRMLDLSALVGAHCARTDAWKHVVAQIGRHGPAVAERRDKIEKPQTVTADPVRLHFKLTERRRFHGRDGGLFMFFMKPHPAHARQGGVVARAIDAKLLCRNSGFKARHDVAQGHLRVI